MYLYALICIYLYVYYVHVYIMFIMECFDWSTTDMIYRFYSKSFASIKSHVISLNAIT